MFTDRIVELARAGYSGLFVTSREERRVRHEVSKAIQHEKLEDWNYYHWDTAHGLINGSTEDLPDILSFCEYALQSIPERTIVTASDLHLHLMGDQPLPQVVQAVRRLLDAFRNTRRMLVGIGAKNDLPVELAEDFHVIELTLPDEELLTTAAKQLCESTGVPSEYSPEVIKAAAGLTLSEAENAFALSLVRTGALTPEIIQQEKEETIKSNGLVEVVQSSGDMQSDVGGLEGLKTWLSARKQAFTREATDYGLPAPKGLLLVGVPGTGKSLAAKCAAAELGLPLLKADAGKWYGSLVGESERNIREVLGIAEAVSPCVLWIDEIEKGLAGSASSGSTDGGTSSRVLGTLLSWLQEKTKPVFVIATANDVTALPPETIRKGRFDELFCVDLPNRTEREDIWKIHIAKKQRDPENYDITNLSRLTDGYTGAEIEAVWVEALYSAFAEGKEHPDAVDIEDAIKATVPLSRTAAERINAIRKWGEGRARPAAVAIKRKTSGRKVSMT